MKRGMILAALLTAALFTGAQAQDRTSNSSSVFADLRIYQTFDMRRYEKNFLKSLEYPEPAIVESALAQVAMLTLAQPATHCASLRNKVDVLAIRGETPAVRYKAYLTSMVFKNPGMFASEKYGTYETGDQLFTALAEQLQKKALATRE